MPKGVARDPTTDKRRNNRGEGRKPTLPPETHVWHVRVTRAERTELAAHLAQIRRQSEKATTTAGEGDSDNGK